MELRGKTAVLTGANSGIGPGLAQTLAREEMNLVPVGHHREGLVDTALAIAGLGGRSITVRADVSKFRDRERMADEATGAIGTVSRLCNNAFVGPFASSAETTMAEWDWVLSGNLWGVIHGMHVFLALFEAQGEGHIYTTASESGLYRLPFLAAYNTSKSAVVGLMQSLACDLRASRSPVTASVPCPGAVRTHILDSARERPETATRSAALPPPTDAFGEMVCDAGSDGMDPEAVGACVLEGIRKGQFWIFSHEHVPQSAFHQAKAMLEENRLIDL
ncbi:MAG: SDR family NAD(P)-dependent oxidoreductase [Pseudomonadota bacterium]